MRWRLESPGEKIDRLPPFDGHERTLSIRLPEATRSGRIVLELSGARKRQGDVTVYDGAGVLIERGQRVALVGPNGAGKTTLLKILAGVLPLDGGERRLGQKVELGYFAQGEAVDKRVGVLSGGERSRLALAKLLIEPVNGHAVRYLGNYEDYLRAKTAPPWASRPRRRPPGARPTRVDPGDRRVSCSSRSDTG